MSNFYRNYRRKEVRQTIINNWLKQHPKKKEQDVPEELLKEELGWYPEHIAREIASKERRKQHLRQADTTTRGKHTGSKDSRKIRYNMHRASSVIKSIMSGYTE